MGVIMKWSELNYKLRRFKYKLYSLKAYLFMDECPCCEGKCGSYSWDEPPEYCGYCKDEGIVYKYKVWEWRKFIEKNQLPPSDWPRYLWNRIRYKDCPETPDRDWFHHDCKSCNGASIVYRFSGKPVK